MQKSSFFNSISGDRRYKAEEWAEYFASFIGNGIFPAPSSGLQVQAAVNMDITVRAGKAWINGYFFNNTTDTTIQLDIANGVLKRIDRLVVRWGLTDRSIIIAVKKGSLSNSPVAPALQRDADFYELALADIRVNNGTISITQANITDQRFNTALCGIVAGTVDQIDASALTAQFDNFFEQYKQQIITEYSSYIALIGGYRASSTQEYSAFLTWLSNYQTAAQAEFSEWFNTIKGLLDGDIATQLAAEILALQGRVSALEKIISSNPYSAAAWLTNSYLGCAFLYEQ